MDKPIFRFSARRVIPFLLFVAVLTLIMPRRGNFQYKYTKGGSWSYETLVAAFDFPILKTEEQLRTEREKLRSKYVPYYTYDESVYEQVSTSIRSVLSGNDLLANTIVLELKPYYDKGILPSATGQAVSEAEDDGIIYVQIQNKASKVSKTAVFSQDKVISKVLQSVSKDLNLSVESVDSILDPKDVYEKILPNLLFDKNTTELVHRKSVDFVSPTSGVFKSGNVIVSTGDVVTADIAQILDSYKAEFVQNVGYNGPAVMMWTGNFLMALVLSLLFFSLLIFSHRETLNEYNKFLFVLTMFLLASVSSFIFSHLNLSDYYLMPYPVFGLYFMAFFRNKQVLPLYTLCLLPLLLFCQDAPQLFIIFLFSGYAAIFAFNHFNKGWRQFVTAIIAFAAMVLSYLAFYLIEGFNNVINVDEILYMLLGSVFIVLAYPLIYLFEIIFNLVSANRLRDLTDTNNALLRSLADKAPGTFQHCLSVMNMADAAARSIDGDVLLIRAASLYHDLGKMYNPQCFVENQTAGIDYHSSLSPLQSAEQIIRHVTDGVEIAEKNGIPSVVRDFIKTHHGTTCTAFFYNKFLNEGGDKSNSAAFFYPGPKPQTKEQVILMLSDTIEAASRTFFNYTPEGVSEFVDKIFAGKMDAQQFSDASITLQELDIVKNTFKEYLLQSHHKRIEYPNETKTNTK